MNSDQYHFSADVSDAVQNLVVNLLGDWEFNLDAEQIWVTPLEGGLNNTNLILQNQTGKWVLKIRPENFAVFGADPVASVTAQSASAKLQIAPKVIACDKLQCHFLSEFLEGVTLRPDYVRQNNLLVSVVDTLHLLHGIQCEIKQRSFFDDIRLFMVGANRESVEIPDEFNSYLKKTYQLEKLLGKVDAPKALCHNDLVPQNFIQCADGISLVDFDYAGRGWIAADLASAASQFEMTADEVENFLSLYDPGLDDGQRGRLAALRFSNNVREIAFTLFAEPLLADTTTTLDDLNYADHRAFNMHQAKLALSDPVFSEQCEAARSVRANALF